MSASRAEKSSIEKQVDKEINNLLELVQSLKEMKLAPDDSKIEISIDRFFNDIEFNNSPEFVRLFHERVNDFREVLVRQATCQPTVREDYV